MRGLIRGVYQGSFFPEITKKTVEIKEILDEEEESFSRTLDRGEKLFDQYATRTKDQALKELNGRDVWRLYDTYGFPVDLTQLMAEELGLTINNDEFEKAQAESKVASQASSKKGRKDIVKLDVHDLAKLEKDPEVPKTDDSAKFCELHNPPDTAARTYRHKSSRKHQCDCEGHLPRSQVPVIDL